MKKLFWGVLGAVFMLTVAMVDPAHKSPVQAACKPAEGDCSASCPAPSFVRGFDKETGDVICGRVTGCPYGDSIPLGPACDKFAPPPAAEPALAPEGEGPAGK